MRNNPETKSAAGLAGAPSNSTPSGLSVLLHTAVARRLAHGWGRLNGLVCPLMPFLHLCMMLVVGAILCAVAFASWHLPSWGDEIFMVDPAFCRTVRGVWQSHGFCDALSVIPYAPNYPLLTNLLRIPIAFIGLNYWVLRTLNLLLGVLPVLALVRFFRRRAILQSRSEELQAVYCVACFTFFHWALQIRPEALLVSVVSLLVFAWMSDRSFLLFLAAFLVPLCGLQWNVLLLPVALHWLAFGGRVRKPLLVAAAFTLSTASTFAAYRLLGMWPSYLQEAARVTTGPVLPRVLSLLHDTYAHWDLRWLFNEGDTPSHLFLNPFFFFAVTLLSACLVPQSRRWLFKRAAFLFLALGGTLVVLAFVHPMAWYSRVILLPLAVCAPLVLRPLRSRHLPLFALLLFFPLYPAHVFWEKVWTKDNSYAGMSDRPYTLLHDEAALSGWASSLLSSDDVVLNDDSAYFAVRGRCRDYFRFRYAVELPPSIYREITAVILTDLPVWSYQRGEYRSVEETVEDLGVLRHCSFEECPVPPPRLRQALRFCLFRPVFSAPEEEPDRQDGLGGRMELPDRTSENPVSFGERRGLGVQGNQSVPCAGIRTRVKGSRAVA